MATGNLPPNLGNNVLHSSVGAALPQQMTGPNGQAVYKTNTLD